MSAITPRPRPRRRNVRPLPSPRLGGCDFVADPRLPASNADVFWSVRSRQVIPAMTTLTALTDDAGAPPPCPSPRAEQTASDGRHLLFRSVDGRDVQVHVLDASGPETPLAAVIPLGPDLPERVAALLDAWHALANRPPVRDPLTPQRRQRLILGLRALDGRAAGASYRALASGLFGAERVPSGAAWKSHDLRSRTLRLVADATGLMRGGYRALAGLPLHSA